MHFFFFLSKICGVGASKLRASHRASRTTLQEPTDFEKAQARAATGGQGKAAAAAAGAAGMNDVESLMAGLTPQERKEVEKMMEQMGDADPTKMMGDMQKVS